MSQVQRRKDSAESLFYVTSYQGTKKQGRPWQVRGKQKRGTPGVFNKGSQENSATGGMQGLHTDSGRGGEEVGWGSVYFNKCLPSTQFKACYEDQRGLRDSLPSLNDLAGLQ